MALEIVESVGSTSDVLKARAEAGAGECALMARVQTAGRGRLGRRWESPRGNLYLSVLLRPGSVRWPGHWSVMAGVALAETASGWAAAGALGLKWPNDLMLDGAKLAGVLVEAGVGAGSPWLVIGFGVNLAEAPSGLGRETASLGGGVSAEAFAGRLLAQLGVWRGRYAGEGFGPVRAAWLGWGPAVGARLVMAGEAGEGKFAGLGDSGALLLDTASGRVAISAGELR